MESRGVSYCIDTFQRTPKCRRYRSGFVILTMLLAVVTVQGIWPQSAAATDLVSIDIHGVSGNGQSNGVSLSTDGSIAAFYSDATSLVANDTNQVRDVFARDRNTGTTERVSVSSAGVQGNRASQALGVAPSISDSGNVVAFYSDANNLVANDTNGTTDVFVRDRQAHTTTLISVNPSGNPGNGPSLFPSISADGRFVAFQSAASDLVPGDTNGITDVFVRDLQSGTTERLCNVQPNAASFTPSISADGNFVAFASAASNLVANDLNGRIDIFVCNRATNTIDLASVSSTGVQGDGNSIVPAINADGRFVAFKSEAANLVPNDINNVVDVFVRDRVAGNTERVSVSFTGGNSNDVSFPPAISTDGRFVIFGSSATNLVPNDARGVSDVFVRDRANAVTLMVDIGLNGEPANGGTPDVPPAISGDGAHIGFASFASNLVLNDKNGLLDVFVTNQPFLCAPGSTCPDDLICVSGFCVPPTPTPTTTSKTPTSTPTKTPISPSPTPTSTPTPIACIGTEDCPSGKVCFEGLCVNPTPTPTPVPCTDSSQCPAGLICLAGICQPAQSPTPTETPTPIPTCSTDADCARACTAATDCSVDQDCVAGFCSPADRCVDGVCAPTRLCESASPTTCIATRETCLNGTCECGGDCDLNGFVFANEVAKMICILSEQCTVSECEAGDFNQDGKITGNEVCQAVTNLGIGCPLGLQSAAPALLSFNSTVPRTVSLVPPPTPVSPGQLVSIGVNLAGNPGVEDVSTAQFDLLFDTTVLSLTDPSVACTVSPAISATDTSFSFMPRRPDTAPNVERLRLFIADLAVCNPAQSISQTAFGDGPLLTCNFIVNPTAPLGTSTLTGERTNLGDIQGNEIPSSGGATDITVVQQICTQDSECPSGLLCRNNVCEPECSKDNDCPSGDVCRTGACVPECTTDSDCTSPLVCRNSFCVPTCTSDSDCSNGLICKDNACVPACSDTTPCPDGSVCVNGGCTTAQCTTSADCSVPKREACVTNMCVCGGDCNGDGVVDLSEILRMASIFSEATPLATCPAGDINGDGIIDLNEILAAAVNVGGCPGAQ